MSESHEPAESRAPRRAGTTLARRGWRPLVLTLAVALGIITWVSALSADDASACGAGAGGRPPLFAATAIPGSIDRSGDPAVVRARFVEVRFDLLEGATGPPGDRAARAEVLHLNLFDDVCLAARLDRLEPTSAPTRFVWNGHVEGVQPSQVTLVVGDGVLSGNVRAPAGTYQVRFAGNGVHAIYQIDPAAFGPD